MDQFKKKAYELKYQGNSISEAKDIWDDVFVTKDITKVTTNDLFLALFFEYRRGHYGFDMDDKFILKLKEELGRRDF